MVPSDDLEPGALRLLDVDNRVVLPTKTHIRVIVTAADVLHCWGIPSLGIKLRWMSWTFKPNICVHSSVTVYSSTV